MCNTKTSLSIRTHNFSANQKLSIYKPSYLTLRSLTNHVAYKSLLFFCVLLSTKPYEFYGEIKSQRQSAIKDCISSARKRGLRWKTSDFYSRLSAEIRLHNTLCVCVWRSDKWGDCLLNDHCKSFQFLSKF